MLLRVDSAAALAPWALLIGQVLGGGRYYDITHGNFGPQRQRVDDTQSKHKARAEPKDPSTFRYLNNKTEPFRIKSLPSIPFDVGEMYSGLVPVYDDPSRALFSVFAPKQGDPVDEIVIWLNGGPGCSSLAGFLQENVRT